MAGSAGIVSVLSPQMTTEKLTAALRRMKARNIATVTMREPHGRAWRVTTLAIDAALVLIEGRHDFIGHGTGRTISSIEYRPAAPKWIEGWRNTQAACIAFHGGDQRTSV